jgi:hypothetical protein
MNTRWRVAAVIAALPGLIQPFWPGLNIGNDASRDLVAGLDIAWSGAVYADGPAVFGTALGSLGPFYYYLLAIPWLTGHPTGTLALLIAGLRLATLWLVYDTARRLGGSAVAWAACLVYATLSVVGESADPLSHNELAPLLVALCLRALIRADGGAGGWWVALAGAALGMAAQFNLSSAAAFPALLWSAAGPGRARRALRIAAATGGFLLPFMPRIGLALVVRGDPVVFSGYATIAQAAATSRFVPMAGWQAAGGIHCIAALLGYAALRGAPAMRVVWRPMILWLQWTVPIGVALAMRYGVLRYALASVVPLAIVAAYGLAGGWRTEGDDRLARPWWRRRWLGSVAVAASLLGAFGATTEGLLAMRMGAPEHGALYESMQWTHARLARLAQANGAMTSSDLFRFVHGRGAQRRPVCTPYSACLPLLEDGARAGPPPRHGADQPRHYRLAGNASDLPLVELLPQMDLGGATIARGTDALHDGESFDLPFRGMELAQRAQRGVAELAVLPTPRTPIAVDRMGDEFAIRIPFLARQGEPAAARVRAVAGAWHPTQPCSVVLTLDGVRPQQSLTHDALFSEVALTIPAGVPRTELVVAVQGCKLMYLDVFDEPEEGP